MALQLLSETALRHWERQTLTIGRTPGRTHVHMLYVVGEMVRYVSGLAAWSGTWKEHNWKIDDKDIREEVSGKSFANG